MMQNQFSGSTTPTDWHYQLRALFVSHYDSLDKHRLYLAIVKSSLTVQYQYSVCKIEYPIFLKISQFEKVTFYCAQLMTKLSFIVICLSNMMTKNMRTLYSVAIAQSTELMKLVFIISSVFLECLIKFLISFLRPEYQLTQLSEPLCPRGIGQTYLELLNCILNCFAQSYIFI